MGIERTEIELGARDNGASAVIGGVLGSMNTLDASVKGLTASFAQLAAATLSVGAMASLVKTGLEFNQTLEDTKLGIASVIGSFSQYSDASGRVLKGVEAFNAASVDAERIQGQLKQAALQTTAQYGEMVEAFQVATGPMTRAKIGLQDQVLAAQRLTQAMGAIGVPMAQLGIEMRQFFQGDFTRSRLLQGLGITKAEIVSLTASGGLMDLLLKKTEGMAIAGQRAADSFTGLTSNLQDFKSQLAGEATVGLFEALKQAMRDISGMLVVLTPQGAVFNKELVGSIKDISDAVAKLVPSVVRLGAAMATFGLASFKAIAEAATAVAPLLNLAAKLLATVAPLVSEFGGLALQIFAVAKILAVFTAGMTANIGIIGALVAGVTGFGVAVAAAFAVYAIYKFADAIRGLIVDLRAAEDASSVAARNLLGNFAKIAAEAAKVGDRGLSRAAKDALNDLVITGDIDKATAALRKMAPAVKEAQIKLKEFDETNRSLQEKEPNKDVLYKLEQQFNALTVQINAVGKTGWAAKFAAEVAQYEAAMESLRKQQKDAEVEDRPFFEPVKAARMRLHSAEQAKIFADMNRADQLRADSVVKAEREINLAYLDGTAKELATLRFRRDSQTKESQDRIKAAEKDTADYAKLVKAEGARQLGYIKEEQAGREAIIRKDGESWRALSIDMVKTAMGAEGDEIGRQALEIAEKYRSLRQEQAKAFAAGFRTGGEEPLFDPEVFKVRMQQINDTEKKEGDILFRDVVTRNAAINSDWDKVWKRLPPLVDGSIRDVRSHLAIFAEYLHDYGKTISDGVLLGLTEIAREIPTKVESIADAVKSIWSGMASSFETGFFDVLSGKFSDLKNIFSSFTDAILHAWARALSNMVEEWISANVKMSIGKGATSAASSGSGSGVLLPSASGGSTYADSPYASTNYTDPYQEGWGVRSYGQPAQNDPKKGGVGSYAGYIGGGLAIAAAGFGSATGGAQSFGQGFSTYLGAANMIAAAGGYSNVILDVIAAVVLLVGLAINLFNKDSEMHAYLTKADIYGGYAALGTGYTGVEQSKTAAGQQVLDNANAITGNLLDTFKLSGAPGASEFAKGMNQIITDYLHGIAFEIHAGSDEDMQADFKALLTTQVPREIISRLFGQTQGPKDLPGISGGTVGTGFSADAPLPKMLAAIGFSADKIAEIAGMISSTDPTAFLKWLNSMVGIVVASNDLIKNLKKTTSEIWAEQAKAAQQNPADAFMGYVKDITQLIQEVSYYTGDEQLAKGQEVLKLAQQRYDEELAYLDKIRQAVDAITASIDSQIKAIDDIGLTRQQGEERARATISGNLTKIAGSSNPDDIAKWTQEAQDAIKYLFDGIVQRLNTANELLSGVQDLAGRFRSFGAAEAPEQTFAGFFQAFSRYQGLVRAANAATGDAQLTAIGKVKAAAEDLYNRQLQLLQTIRSNMTSLWESINRQKLDLNYASITEGGGNTKEQNQAAYIIDRIHRLQELTKNAKSPEELKGYTDEIQSLVSKYLGLFKEDDPKRAEAIAALKNMLDYTEAIAHDAYERMYADIDAANKKIAESLDGIGATLTATMTSLNTELGELKTSLETLRTTSITALKGVADQVVAAMALLVPQIEALKKGFMDVQKAIDPTGAGDTNPINPNNPDGTGPRRKLSDNLDDLSTGSKSAATAANDLATSLINLRKQIDGDPGGRSAGEGGGASASQAPRSTRADLVNFLRRNPTATARTTGV